MPQIGIFQELFEELDQGFAVAEMIVDEDGRPFDYRFLHTNTRFEVQTGLMDAEGRTARALVPDLEQTWVDTYARAGLHGERMRFQMGSEAMGRWYDVFAMPLGDHGQFAIVFRDETARRSAEVEREALLAQEHALSRRLQRALLPEGIEKDERLTIDVCYQSAESLMEVGGDWYDTFRWSTGEIGVLVGDVAGHDLEAAVMMGQLRAGTRVLALTGPPSPRWLLQSLVYAARHLGDPDFVTAVAMVVDPSTGELSWASAGHPAALVVRHDGEVEWLTEGHNPAVGLSDLDTAVPGHRTLEPGDRVVTFSDGLVERRGESIDVRLGELRRRCRVLAEQGCLTAERLKQGMVGDEPSDDVTVVVLGYEGEALG